MLGVPAGIGSGRTNEWKASSTDGERGNVTSGEDREAGLPEARYGDELEGDLPKEEKNRGQYQLR